MLPFKHGGRYVQGIPFSRIQHLYYFDSQLRNLCLSVIEQIEHYCRTLFAREFVNHHGPLGYTFPVNFSKTHDHTRFLNKLSEYKKRNKRSLVVQHHMTQYAGDFPLWVMIEFFSISDLSYFYSDMLTPAQKSTAAVYNTSVACLKSWMRCVSELRNRCAHFSRLYFLTFPSIPKLPSTVKFVSDRTLFSQMLMLSLLYPDALEWNNTVLVNLETLINNFSNDISLSHIVFPPNWKQLLTR